MPKQETPEITCCGETLEFKAQEGWADWQSYRPEISGCGSCEAYFEKKPEEKIAYKRSKGEEHYQCTNCGKGINTVTRAHPIHDGPFPLSGSGQCKYQSVPYCPKCEEKPNESGLPITVR